MICAQALAKARKRTSQPRRATAAQAESLLTEPKNELIHAVRRRDPRLTRLIALSLRGGRALV